MTEEEFREFVGKVDCNGVFICIAELDEGFGSVTHGYARDIIAHAIKLIVHTTERLSDEKMKIHYIRAAANSLNIGAKLMELNAKEKAPDAAATALGAKK